MTVREWAPVVQRHAPDRTGPDHADKVRGLVGDALGSNRLCRRLVSPSRVSDKVCTVGPAARVESGHYLEAVVGPRRELHGAVLLVERKVLDVDVARAAEYRHRQPRHVPVRRHDDVVVVVTSRLRWRHDDVGADGWLVGRHVSANVTPSHDIVVQQQQQQQ